MMKGESVHLVQNKKRSKGQANIEVYVPIHPAWKAAVAAVPARAETILYDRYGRSFRSPGPLQERIWTAMLKLGYVRPNGKPLYSFHGLRKNSTNYLAEMGLSPHKIGAINGMSIETVTLYTRGVETKRLSDSSREQVLAGDVAKMGRA